VISSARSLKERQRQEREDLILQAAGEVLLEKGYHDASMDEIAARVGIAKGTLYLHFAKKDDLVFAFLGSVLQEVIHTIEETSTLQTSAQERLWTIALAMYREPYGRRRACYLYLLFGSDDLKARGRKQLDGMFSCIRNTMAALLDEGKARGEFDASLPTSMMVNTFFNVFSPRAYDQSMGDAQLSSQEVLLTAARIYFRGIGARLPDQE
jgi:AcrR family transcriptional regulator